MQCDTDEYPLATPNGFFVSNFALLSAAAAAPLVVPNLYALLLPRPPISGCVWNINVRTTNSATRISAKFKLLRQVLEKWSKKLSNLSGKIKNCNPVLETLDALEEQRPLFLQEYNFRLILKEHILKLLRYKKEYWKKRYTIRWTKFGD